MFDKLQVMADKNSYLTQGKTNKVNDEMETEEIRVKLSLGEIAGKWYGSKRRRPIILIHGFQDNAGSFATLIPLLSVDFSYFAIDLPGHGLSSHYPKGWTYYAMDFISVLEQLRLKFKWERLSLMGHSMGAVISFMYAATYIDKVDLICAIDTLKPQQLTHSQTAAIYVRSVYQSVSLNNTNSVQSPPCYGYDELVERFHTGSLNSIDPKKAKYLIERGAKQTANEPTKYYFTGDIRTTYLLPFYTLHPISLQLIKRIEAAYLFIRGDDHLFSESEDKINDGIQCFQKNNKRFEMFRVKGTHHFHLNQPEQIVAKVNAFLKKYYIFEHNRSENLELKSNL